VTALILGQLSRLVCEIASRFKLAGQDGWPRVGTCCPTLGCDAAKSGTRVTMLPHSGQVAQSWRFSNLSDRLRPIVSSLRCHPERSRGPRHAVVACWGGGAKDLLFQVQGAAHTSFCCLCGIVGSSLQKPHPSATATLEWATRLADNTDLCLSECEFDRTPRGLAGGSRTVSGGRVTDNATCSCSHSTSAEVG
jgi:hypothetical protein